MRPPHNLPSDISHNTLHIHSAPTRFQVAELGERPPLQMLQVKGVGLPACQVPHGVFVDHADAAELHQSAEHERDLTERQAAH